MGRAFRTTLMRCHAASSNIGRALIRSRAVKSTATSASRSGDATGRLGLRVASDIERLLCGFYGGGDEKVRLAGGFLDTLAGCFKVNGVYFYADTRTT